MVRAETQAKLLEEAREQPDPDRGDDDHVRLAGFRVIHDWELSEATVQDWQLMTPAEQWALMWPETKTADGGHRQRKDGGDEPAAAQNSSPHCNTEEAKNQ